LQDKLKINSKKSERIMGLKKVPISILLGFFFNKLPNIQSSIHHNSKIFAQCCLANQNQVFQKKIIIKQM